MNTKNIRNAAQQGNLQLAVRALCALWNGLYLDYLLALDTQDGSVLWDKLIQLPTIEKKQTVKVAKSSTARAAAWYAKSGKKQRNVRQTKEANHEERIARYSLAADYEVDIPFQHGNVEAAYNVFDALLSTGFDSVKASALLAEKHGSEGWKPKG